MRRFLRLEAVVHTERHAALKTAGDAIAAAGGWIEDHNLLSDVMATIAFVIPANRAEVLARSLAEAGFILDRPAAGDWTESEQDLSGQLTMLFSKGGGDLTHERPAFH